jgi:FkbM family methyltransferase
MSGKHRGRAFLATVVPHRVKQAIYRLRAAGGQSVDRAILSLLSLALDRRPSGLDVFFAYRLLLNRRPDREGFSTYRRLVGRQLGSLEELVDEFLRSEEFRKRQGRRQDESVGPPYQAKPVAEEVVKLPAFSIYIDGNDAFIGRAIKERGDYEHFVSAALRRLLKPGNTFVDVGANIGYFSLLGATLVGPEGRVIAIEPAPPNHALLTKSIALNGFSHVELHPVALSAKTGRARVSPTERRNSGSFRFVDDAGDLGSFEVETRALDDLVGDRTVQVIKMDIEGAEGLALPGMERTLRRDRPVIVMELSPRSLETVSQVSGEELLGRLEGMGYGFQDVVDYGVRAQRTSLGELLRRLSRQATDHLDLIALPDERPARGTAPAEDHNN